VGSTICQRFAPGFSRSEVYPETGNQRSTKAKSRKRSTPRKNSGMDTPAMEIIMAL
jgi:hypothetical protein